MGHTIRKIEDSLKRRKHKQLIESLVLVALFLGLVAAAYARYHG